MIHKVKLPRLVEVAGGVVARACHTAFTGHCGKSGPPPGAAT